jgi:hypothetical protein
MRIIVFFLPSAWNPGKRRIFPSASPLRMISRLPGELTGEQHLAKTVNAGAM